MFKRKCKHANYPDNAVKFFTLDLAANYVQAVWGKKNDVATIEDKRRSFVFQNRYHLESLRDSLCVLCQYLVRDFRKNMTISLIEQS